MYKTCWEFQKEEADLRKRAENLELIKKLPMKVPQKSHDSGKPYFRESKKGKLKYFNYFTPAILRRYGEHMEKWSLQHEGVGSDNWQKGGYPKEEYLQSVMRHLLALQEGDTSEDHAAAIVFNIFGYMHEERND